MVKFEIDGQKYKTPEGWHEVSFKKFMSYLSDVAPNEPEELKDFVSSHLSFIADLEESIPKEEKEELSVDNWNKSWDKLGSNKQLICYEYFAIEIGFWCELEKDVVRNSLDKTQLSQAFWSIQIVLNLTEAEEQKDFVSFMCKNKQFFLPSKHMEGSTVAEFAEAAQFEDNVGNLMEGKWDSMLDVMVVLCRPKGEKYNYEKTKHNIRKKMFQGLTMDIIINVAFFLLKQNDILRNNLLIYSLLDQVQEKELQKLERSMAGLY